MIQIQISNGELIDRFTILEIKRLRIIVPVKKKHILHEWEMIEPLVFQLCTQFPDLHNWLSSLQIVNNELWEIEDNIRIKEKKQEFDREFIELARSVYTQNDLRSEIKREINQLTHSEIIEEKSYQ